MKCCSACSMPLDRQEDLGVSNTSGNFCIYCINDDKSVKRCIEIFNNGVAFFQKAVPGLNRAEAEKLVRKNMNRLPYWLKNTSPCLQGDEATDEEYQQLIAKL